MRLIVDFDDSQFRTIQRLVPRVLAEVLQMVRNNQVSGIGQCVGHNRVKKPSWLDQSRHASDCGNRVHNVFKNIKGTNSVKSRAPLLRLDTDGPLSWLSSLLPERNVAVG